MKKNVLLYCVLVAIAILVVGCRHRPKPDALSEKINSNCTVYFNRAPGNNITDGVGGKLLKVTPEWIVIGTNVSKDVNNAIMEKFWVPRSAVLYIRTE